MSIKSKLTRFRQRNGWPAFLTILLIIPGCRCNWPSWLSIPRPLSPSYEKSEIMHFLKKFCVCSGWGCKRFTATDDQWCSILSLMNLLREHNYLLKVRISDLSSVNIHWKMLTTARPANKMEETIFTKLVLMLMMVKIIWMPKLPTM